jgi:lipopolysaccharide biosynthesis glycosyltransferase
MNTKSKVKDCIPIVFSSDDNYALYLGVCIKSIIEHSSLSNNYAIFIIDGGISENHKNQILTMKTKNVSIEFVDIKPFLQNIDLSIFSLSLHFTISTYYRFFLPKIFGNYDKLIYLDCDMLVLRDVKELFDIDIGDNYLGATRDMGILSLIATDNLDEHNYYVVTLGLEKCENCFNAGCMICNVKKMREDDLTKKFIEKLCEIKKPKFVDQCILNAVCRNQVKYISNNWNFTWHLLCGNYPLPHLPSPYKENYLNAFADPYIIHFTSHSEKPWINPALQKSDICVEICQNDAIL